MSNEEFLARWSRRKQEAKEGRAARQSEVAPDLPTSEGTSDARIEQREPDLASLPPIEAIDAKTDITAFLRKGIPHDLTREALRRAWSADPAIRDFLGPAENAWDFNDPNAMPGFGPLDYSPQQVQELVHRIVGGVREAAHDLADALTEATGHTERSSSADLSPTPAPTLLKDNSNGPSEPEAVSRQPCTDAVAPQPIDAAEYEESPALGRRHGSALPR